MSDKKLVEEILIQIHHAVLKVIDRSAIITKVSDFTDSAAGMEKLDAICMQLIAIGESLKNIDKITAGRLLSKYSEIDWRGAKGMRDIITHHYFDIDADAIFSVCKEKIEPLGQTIQKIIQEL